ncbi:Uncharacterised protein [Corynebacterium cystitidis]|uniref:Uncharacterized protein n=1 Tax=Corynebacterium cystitidis DSM 20524 TaxID=1121357 RepID=A0A1H9V6B8_9CORY|nr:hypothetical protein SAMN05661109_02093 [Corynebacterium cystitidis DSM 20524]SNV63325.1 Uncharacterised protein [Corynebacterium cystitidis]
MARDERRMVSTNPKDLCAAVICIALRSVTGLPALVGPKKKL